MHESSHDPRGYERKAPVINQPVDVNRRASELQAVGPDEFPFGYYQYLAQREADGEDD